MKNTEKIFFSSGKISVMDSNIQTNDYAVFPLYISTYIFPLYDLLDDRFIANYVCVCEWQMTL